MATDSINLDRGLIADRLLCRRDELRLIPGDIQAACELARAMVVERDMCAPSEWADYNTYRHLDALIAMVEGTALYLSSHMHDVLGESDSDLPTKP